MLDVDMNFHCEYGDAWWRAFSCGRRVMWWWHNEFRRHARGIVRYIHRMYFDSLDLAIRALIAENPYIVGE